MEKDIWQNLYDFHLLEIIDEVVFEEIKRKQEKGNITKTLNHKLTHQNINALFILQPTDKTKGIKGLEPVRIKQLSSFPIPTLIKKYIEKEPKLFNSF